MSIYSDHNCGALSDEEFQNACTMMNNKEAIYEMEHETMQEFVEDEEESI